MSVLILSNVPISYIVLKLGLPPYYCTIGFVVIEMISLVVRLYMSHRIVGIDIKEFVKIVIVPVLLSVTLSLIPAYAIHVLMPTNIIRSIIVFVVYISAFAMTAWHLTLQSNERAILANLMSRISRIIKN